MWEGSAPKPIDASQTREAILCLRPEIYACAPGEGRGGVRDAGGRRRLGGMGGAARRQETRRRRGWNGGVGAARVHGDDPGGAGAEWSQTDEGGVAVHLAFFSPT